MKVKLNKHHVLGAETETVEVDEQQANYLHRVGVITLSDKKAEKVEEAVVLAGTETTEQKEEKPGAKVTKEEKVTAKKTK